MNIIKFTTKGFDKNSPVSPDNYYLEQCTMILDSIFKNIKCDLKDIDGGGGGGQGGGYVWIAYEYFENEIKKDICIIVKHDGLDIEVNISCNDKTYDILNKFLDELNNLINDI
jgi:hypothetical protein